jgi:hypothetical protein
MSQSFNEPTSATGSAKNGNSAAARNNKNARKIFSYAEMLDVWPAWLFCAGVNPDKETLDPVDIRGALRK